MITVSNKRNYLIQLVVSLILTAILIAIPTGYEDAAIYTESERCTAEVISTDESSIISTGLIQSGQQYCELRINDGKFEGQTVSGVNLLTGSLENDKIYKASDTASVVVSYSEDNSITSVTMTDHYRLDKEIILAVLFVVLLILFSGKNGIFAVMSFVITVLMIWKILVPCYLNGLNPIWIGIGIMTILTALIIFLVYGIDKRTLTAFMGSMLGTVTTCIMGIFFTDMFKIHGAVMSYSETLLYSGYQNLNLTQIFTSGIFIGASGAMMDLAVDITSAIHEVIQKKPDIGWREAANSGMNVGRAAMGTMTTTLLLAYSGGYIALLMTFMAQGTPIDHILNFKYVSAEILHTLVGSFGLVTVAPFTALMSGIMLTKKDEKTAA
ncbi:hypothetical protein SDC9_72184 [bioreactor metagenome]|uniref:YibE/F-like protein n=1 Tax=bioreactor metagenome TaxID=1076179 RepID=A0A644YAX1_9ZZZZ|nr:YibE/F family protein [Candidatus Metalachnospira sp.]